MELMTWTDARLEERFAHIDAGFDRLEAVVAVKAETRELQKNVEKLTAEVRTLREEMKSEIQGLRGEMKSEIQGLREEMREIRKSIETTHLLMHRDRHALLIAMIALIGAVLVRGG